MPTLLGLCGVPTPKTVEGLDYSRYANGGKNPGDNSAVIQCVAPFGEWVRLNGGKEYRGIRTPRYTYVRDIKGPWLLYDNVSDPYQQKNLAGVADATTVQQEMDALLTKKLAAVNDEFKPADFYLTKWGYKDRLDKAGALPTDP